MTGLQYSLPAELAVRVRAALARAAGVGFEIPEPLARAFPFVFPAVVAAFYLIWKRVVGCFNELLGIA